MHLTQIACQGHSKESFSRPSVPYLVYRFYWHTRNGGLLRAIRKTVNFAYFKLAGTRPVISSTVTFARAACDDALKLQPGELVEVKSQQEILETLDDARRTKGLVFMPGMFRYCGLRFRVYKRLERMLFEESGKRRTLKNTVLLEGVICDGEGVGCDRSCFYFWREAWLKRVNPG